MGRSWDGKRGREKDQKDSTIRKLHYENGSLKREVTRLRKQLSLVNSGWCPGCLKAHEEGEHEGVPEPEKVTVPVKNEHKDRTCFSCKEGKLELVKYYKQGDAWYFRKCNNSHCKNRTRGKKWTKEVKE